MELGLVTFADVAAASGSAQEMTPQQRMKNLMEEVKLADEVGLDVFAIGEHHRPDFAVSAPATALAGAATITENIRLSSAVTVLSSEDPVRVFQQFATVDLLSNGRAEIMAGRGSFTESFPIFGQDLRDYDDLYREKLELLLQLRDQEVVTWSGRHRAPLDHAGIYPRPAQDPLPVWVAVGGTPASVARAGDLGLPLTIAIIGGEPRRFAPLVELYRAHGAAAGHDPSKLKVAINTHGFLAETSEAAVSAFAPAYLPMMRKIGMERGWPPMTQAQFEGLRSKHGALSVGTPQEMIEKILDHYELFQHDRYLSHFSVGSADHKAVLKSIELFGTEVAPVVRAEIAKKKASSSEVIEPAASTS